MCLQQFPDGWAILSRLCIWEDGLMKYPRRHSQSSEYALPLALPLTFPSLSMLSIVNLSYMSANVLLNLLNKLGENDKMRGFAEHLIGFS